MPKVMNPEERELALKVMQATSDKFYATAVRIGNHPFIEFTGLLNEYIKACRNAHAQGIDFTDCSAHSGIELPLREFEINYINEKLECIYGGRVRLTGHHATGSEGNARG